MTPIIVDTGMQATGATFRLNYKTREMLASRIPDWSRPCDYVFIGYDFPGKVDRIRGSMWAQVVMLLTGLDEEQIRTLGGFRIVIPVDEEVVFESLAA